MIPSLLFLASAIITWAFLKGLRDATEERSSAKGNGRRDERA